MGDINDGNALGGKLSHDCEQPPDFRLCQRGSRFVQNNYFRIIGDCLRNLTHLSLGDRHPSHRLCQIHSHSKSAEQIRSFLFHARFIDHAVVHRVSPEEQIVDHGALQALIQFLVDHRHPVLQSILRSGKAHRLSIQIDGALVHMVYAKQTLHHGRLPGSVLPHQSHDDASFHIHADVVENPVSPERLGHITDRQNDILFLFCHCFTPPVLVSFCCIT